MANNLSPNNMNTNVKKVIDVLNKDFVVVGRRRAKTWQSWLFIGVIIGVAIGVTLVANRTGQFESSQAAPSLSTPSNLIAQSLAVGQIKLQWQDTNTQESGFEVWRSLSSIFNFSKIANTSANSLTFTNSNLLSNTTYYYKVRAYQVKGRNTYYSSYSNIANAKTFDFSLTNGGDKSVIQGNSAANTITATLIAGTSQSVNFSIAGLPANTTASFSPTSCSVTCSTTLTLTTS